MATIIKQQGRITIESPSEEELTHYFNAVVAEKDKLERETKRRSAIIATCGAKCERCRGRGIVPDWSNFKEETGEPHSKPCPVCTEEPKCECPSYYAKEEAALADFCPVHGRET